MKIGIIGCGVMGTMIAEKLLHNRAEQPVAVVVSERGRTNSSMLKERYPSVSICLQNHQIAADCDVVILCTAPEDQGEILKQIARIPAEQLPHLVSIASSINLEDLCRMYPGPVSRLMPTITSLVGEGVSLLCHADRTESEMAWRLKRVLSCLGNVSEVVEKEFDLMTHFTSSGPALITVMVQCLVAEGVRQSGLPADTVERMVVDTMIGAAGMLQQGLVRPDDMIDKVSTAKGITIEGVKVLYDTLPAAFHETIKTMQDRRSRLSREFQRDNLLQES